MRISDGVISALFAVALTAPVAFALDPSAGLGERSASVAPVLALDPGRTGERSTIEAFRAGTKSYMAGDKGEALKSLQYAANQGHTGATWKLGRMYADGDGVRRDELKAYEYFRRIANLHADDAPGSPQAPFVANAFVELGGFFLRGIPNTAVVRDPVRAREMFHYAASWFGDADAQYHLARLYLEGVGTEREPLTAARWLGLAAQKGQYQAQALLGALLFKGEGVPRQAARGLMWLTLAREAAATADDGWIVDTYDNAFKVATEDERAVALTYLQQWLKIYR
ncbi:tetratricopeptide repeat protein [Blastochloris tepida]|jgi:TPR repeat protein|uniref:Exopolysaccharide production negative regulator n=1 Tax=Blastochloris tepida TaxID=2233851 RepID=A0A348FYZ7_9HYPH|nr:tetratricopeptide repeat protein [Blastochloris tepida]BBF92530.1 exopolysaccharide production negative regulator [Blastochloris tepida]